ncbi:hypothetical protein DXG03_003503 [Asterophora parasitica]|uniref:CcmS related domain-containing protein n=1 Tax=Asterophora parasitica TaxID=117018 RepID=A0A9P7KDE0_9AGAR|nr:hypothetical protein DXG03_003503 [Asterophora parasitica]
MPPKKAKGKGKQQHEAQHDDHTSDLNDFGHGKVGTYEDDGWGNKDGNEAVGWGNDAGESGDGGQWGDNGWGGDADGDELEYVDHDGNVLQHVVHNNGAWVSHPLETIQEGSSPSQPEEIPIPPTSIPTLVPPPPPAAAPSESHDQRSAAQFQAAQHQGLHQGQPPLQPTQQVYTSASAMANRGARPAPARAEQRVQDPPPTNRPSYMWNPNPDSRPKPATSTTSAHQKASVQHTSAWRQDNNVDIWGSPKSKPNTLPEPAPAPPEPKGRQAWQDWGKKAQTPLPARAPPVQTRPAHFPWTSAHYDDDDDEEDDEEDHGYGRTDPWGRPTPRAPSGWGQDPRILKQSKVTFASGSDNGAGTGSKPVLSPQEHSEILQSLLNGLPQSQHGFPPQGGHPQKSGHQQRQQQIPHHPHASMDVGKKFKKQPQQKGGTWDDMGAAAGGGGGWGAGGGGDAWGANSAAGDNDGWGGAGGWDKPARGGEQGWGQGDGWDTQDNSWSNTKGSDTGWGDGAKVTGNDGWGKGGGGKKDNGGQKDDGFGDSGGWGNGKDSGWGDEDDGWDEGEGGEDEWDQSHRHHHAASSKLRHKHATWGEVRRESTTYHMPSKTLAHAMKGTNIKATNGVPPNKMDEYTNTQFLESGNKAFLGVQRAIFGRERKARDRIHWLFSPDKDERVSAVLAWIVAMEYNLGSFGLHKFLQSRERGALFVNVTFRLENYPNQPVFDWLTFDDLQKSTDRILQESVLTCNPSETVVIFVYLPSPTGNSVAMWRRKVKVPNNTRLRFQEHITAAKNGLRKDENYVVHVDEIFPPKQHHKGKAAHPPTQKTFAKQPPKANAKPLKSALAKHQRGQSLPNIPDLTVKQKRRWWQILRFA